MSDIDSDSRPLACRAQSYLTQLAENIVLQMRSTKPSASKARKNAKKAASASVGTEVSSTQSDDQSIVDASRGTSSTNKTPSSGDNDKEEISILVMIRVNGGLMTRSLAQLSGGERRRVALALALGFADLVRSRGRLSCNLMVLDEALQQLDGEGCARVAGVLRGLPHDSVLVVGQALSYVTQVFDVMDVVVKHAGGSLVQIS